MGIDKQSDVSANIQIGPTDEGMVRIYVEAEGGIELPLDFDPEEAEEIAEELRAAADALGTITGRIDVEGILDVVFRDFCIGK